MNAVDSTKRTRLSQRYWGSHFKSVKLTDSLSQVQGLCPLLGLVSKVTGCIPVF